MNKGWKWLIGFRLPTKSLMGKNTSEVDTMHEDLTLYLIRHGQTDWNNDGRFQGQMDIPLNQTGHAQAIANGKTLAAYIGGQISRFRFVSSPLSRARETMEHIRAALGIDQTAYETEPALLERCLGDWEGKTVDELPIHIPGQVIDYTQVDWLYAPPGRNAESREVMSSRISDWLENLSTPTICVTHGGVIRAILKLIGPSSNNGIVDDIIHQDRILRYQDGAFEWLSAPVRREIRGTFPGAK